MSEQRRIEMILEADARGRTQQLSVSEAEEQLHRSLYRRIGGLAKENGPSVELWRQLGYWSVAHDAAALTVALLRTYPEASFTVAGAHLRLMRSMVAGAAQPEVGPLWRVTERLRG